MLAERGIDKSFCQWLLDYSTAVEQQHYVKFLEDLQGFVKLQWKMYSYKQFILKSKLDCFHAVLVRGFKILFDCGKGLPSQVIIGPLKNSDITTRTQHFKHHITDFNTTTLQLVQVGILIMIFLLISNSCFHLNNSKFSVYTWIAPSYITTVSIDVQKICFQDFEKNIK